MQAASHRRNVEIGERLKELRDIEYRNEQRTQENERSQSGLKLLESLESIFNSNELGPRQGYLGVMIWREEHSDYWAGKYCLSTPPDETAVMLGPFGFRPRRVNDSEVDYRHPVPLKLRSGYKIAEAVQALAPTPVQKKEGK